MGVLQIWSWHLFKNFQSFEFSEQILTCHAIKLFLIDFLLIFLNQNMGLTCFRLDQKFVLKKLSNGSNYEENILWFCLSLPSLYVDILHPPFQFLHFSGFSHYDSYKKMTKILQWLVAWCQLNRFIYTDLSDLKPISSYSKYIICNQSLTLGLLIKHSPCWLPSQLID